MGGGQKSSGTQNAQVFVHTDLQKIRRSFIKRKYADRSLKEG